ncbi:hypothetical protein Tco_1216969 [Tanacetum coccineum]
MRIRKNAKFSSFYHTNLSNVNSEKCELQTKSFLSCELNQSPWDIINSSSLDLLYQFDDNEDYYNVNLDGSGSLTDSTDFLSVASWTSGLGESENVNDSGENLGFKEVMKCEILDEIKLCGERDEEGWQCGNVVRNGNEVCDYHLCEAQDYSVWTTKKKSEPVSGPATERRPRRYRKKPTTNPLEYYYYSGFGPAWGKKRGSVDTAPNGYNEASLADHMNVQEEKGLRFEPEMVDVGSMKAESGYMDVDGDVGKGKVGIIGKKRGRKPIKERSLKSLM